MPEPDFLKRFGGSAPQNYESYFVPAIGRPLAIDLVESAALRPGERVLDAACGTGIVARLALDRVGAQGIVAGLDVNPGMLAVARSVLPVIEWFESHVESMPLKDDSFDVVLCQMGLQFVQDKPGALKEMRRVLVPGGRMLFNVPGPTPTIFKIADDALGRYIGPEAAGFIRVVFSLHHPGQLEELVTSAGFRDVRVERSVKKLRLPLPQEFLWQYIQSSPLMMALAGADEETRSRLEEDVVERWQPFVEGRAMILDLGRTVVSAKK